MPKSFNDDFIRSQLKVIAAIPFLELIRSGYPKRVDRESLQFKFDEHIMNRAKTDRKLLCRYILSSMGFIYTDYKIEKIEILFRPGKSNLDQIINCCDEEFIKNIASNVNRRIARSLWKSVYIFWRAFFFCK